MAQVNFHDTVSATLATYENMWSENFDDYERVVRRYATDLQERLKRRFPYGINPIEVFEYLEEEIGDNYNNGEGWQASVAQEVLEAVRKAK